MRYDFTEQEVSILKQLIDLAIRNSGLQVAEVGVVLVKKLCDPIVEGRKEPVKKEKVDEQR